jgi:hypothetical protein
MCLCLIFFLLYGNKYKNNLSQTYVIIPDYCKNRKGVVMKNYNALVEILTKIKFQTTFYTYTSFSDTYCEKETHTHEYQKF